MWWQATLVSKDSKDGQLLLEAAGNLPLVLISSPGTTTECVWRGIEVGAADVLERPLSLLKLQNIWQHVVRKVIAPAGSSHQLDTLGSAQQPPVWAYLGPVSAHTSSHCGAEIDHLLCHCR